MADNLSKMEKTLNIILFIILFPIMLPVFLYIKLSEKINKAVSVQKERSKISRGANRYVQGVLSKYSEDTLKHDSRERLRFRYATSLIMRSLYSITTEHYSIGNYHDSEHLSALEQLATKMVISRGSIMRAYAFVSNSIRSGQEDCDSADSIKEIKKTIALFEELYQNSSDFMRKADAIYADVKGSEVCERVLKMHDASKVVKYNSEFCIKKLKIMLKNEIAAAKRNGLCNTSVDGVSNPGLSAA
ncbi:hypothetical protein ECHHL_0226 [Ehrlichia chaffeensis str. Heartland]|uniref:Uncharacterized protein n=1 Tax=Ehrlichia chaffeensis (strain ATCC CRL-10679 / Arkansas) TaxID=205920 RepID=Q2GHJ0_EHRCR|nr:hypothetical protein [Ehrlichia chaffeensis]ABD44509.1 hypothetical protein ECH_0272 [Ehrlichia chaffeensis str. Arkansas]AHX03392.1 hypothetical protein ECHHL_0226 [Ehrlichia chaffeensis str. Heartland]AHX05887.1 hypothetical protein ECHJAX_0831 [Ehrlichia chaffeensis str. Jax]AHX07296.1 hypothetical protein ECHOSC_0234 [Ehrlichia chaffeensis str. Osceola]AHX09023.1 hypothetical protein ECHSTV_0821 [Ehrlichia chaffeensis str. Saint Vincent]